MLMTTAPMRPALTCFEISPAERARAPRTCAPRAENIETACAGYTW
jgi:hypothetical protein